MLSRKTVLAALVALVALSGAGYSGYRVWRHFQPAAAGQAAPKTAVVLTAPTATPEAPVTPTAPPTPTPLPPSVFIKVPYTSQFPFSGQWKDPAHLEYCEAAALLMTSDFFKGDARDRIPAAEADSGMGLIFQTERRTFPNVKDLPLASIATVGTQMFGLRPTMMPVSMESIERQLAAGRPVIIPVMTHGGPNGAKIAYHYADGDSYHVIVVTGYDSGKGLLYTNDAGFIEGQNWTYDWNTLSTAIDSANRHIGQGRTMLVFDKG